MIGIQNRRLMPVLLVAFALVSTGYAQDAGKAAQSLSEAKTIQVSAGQKMNVEGVILSQQSNGMTLRSIEGATYNIVIAGNTEMKEKKSNPFRGAKNIPRRTLFPACTLKSKVRGTAPVQSPPEKSDSETTIS